MSELGKTLVIAVFVLCTFSTAFGLAARLIMSRVEKAGTVLYWARRLMFIAAALSIIVLILLTVAFLTDDFSIAAVAQYSSTKLPFYYKISAVWAGSAGSLLLWWVFVLVVFALWQSRLVGIQNLREAPAFRAVALSVGSGICLGFSALLVFIAKPFAAVEFSIDEGMGLNPLLQNFWMVIHPPILFIGYSAFLVPFVATLAYVLSNRENSPLGSGIYRIIRRWLLVGICFLSAGIVTGARWSYVELGWGGYWAHDPVENASILPWFVAVAALHSIAGMRVADKFRLWAIVLAPLPFILCLVGTFITRSGILSSLHSFDQSVMSSALLVFISCCLLFWFAGSIRAFFVPAYEKAALPKGQFYLDKSEILFWTNIILIVTAAVVGIATFWPVIGCAISGSKFTPTAVFYNRVFTISGIILVFLLGLVSLSDLPRGHSSPTIIVLLSCIGLVCFGCVLVASGRLAISLALGICAFSYSSILVKFLLGLKPKGTIASRIAHLGLLLLVIAVGFSWNEQSVQAQLTKGERIMLAGFEFVCDSFEHKVDGEVTCVGPQIVVKKKGLQKSLWPHSSIYPAIRGEARSTSEVAVHTGLIEDVYVSFDGISPDGGVVITAKIKPFMLWLWLACALVIFGIALAAFGGKRKHLRSPISDPRPPTPLVYLCEEFLS